MQSEHFNKTGQARTQDHQLPDAELSRKVATGKGKWKTWTPEAVLRAGFGHETATCRQVASEVEGASASHSRNARFACASAACRFQEQSCEKVAADSLARPLKFFIRSLMFDESSFALKVGTDPANSCSVLCSHAQWAMASPPSVAGGQPTIRDEHVVRPPQILAPMNSATMWKTLSEHPGGLGPRNVAAEHTCTLTTCDSHSANIKMLKHVDSTLPADHLFLPTLCVQHRNGNVVEQLAHLLGNLSGCFCASRVLNSRHTVQALRRRTRAALERDLVFLESEPVGVQAEWAEARSLTRRFLKMAAMIDAAAKKDDDSAADAGPDLVFKSHEEILASTLLDPSSHPFKTLYPNISRVPGSFFGGGFILGAPGRAAGIPCCSGGGECWIVSIHAAGNVEFLRKNGITAIVSCASNVPVARSGSLKHMGTYDGTAVAKGNIKWFHVIAMLDAVWQEIKAGGWVCKNGARRSAEITALFLCFITGENPDKVMRHIRAIREMTDFDSAHPGGRHSFDRRS